MNATVSDLIHGLCLLVLDETGAPSTTSLDRRGDRRLVRSPEDLPEGRYELHFVGTPTMVAPFRAGLALAGSNTVEALPGDDPASGAVLVRFAAEERPAGERLEDVIPLIRHWEPGSQIVASRWKTMREKVHSTSASPSASVKSIMIVDESVERMRLRVRYGTWAYFERRRKHDIGSSLHVAIVGDSDRHRLEVRFDEHKDPIHRHWKALAEDLSDIAGRYGGRVADRAIVFDQPEDPVSFLRDLEPMADELDLLDAKAQTLVAHDEVLENPAGRRVVKQLKDGGRIAEGDHCILTKADGSTTRIPYTLFALLRKGDHIRRVGAREWAHGRPDPATDYVDPPMKILF